MDAVRIALMLLLTALALNAGLESGTMTEHRATPSATLIEADESGSHALDVPKPLSQPEWTKLVRLFE